MSDLAPTAQDRIASLDILRGFALLGILVMNIQSFSMIEAAYFNPMAYGNLEGINYAVWYVSHLLVDSKFMAIFSMMFGASLLYLLVLFLVAYVTDSGLIGRRPLACGRSRYSHVETSRSSWSGRRTPTCSGLATSSSPTPSVVSSCTCSGIGVPAPS